MFKMCYIGCEWEFVLPSRVDECDVRFWSLFWILFSAFFRLLVEGFVDEFDALHYVENRYLILIYGLGASLVSVNFLRHDSSLILDEVKGLHHEFGDCTSVYTDSQHT